MENDGPNNSPKGLRRLLYQVESGIQANSPRLHPFARTFTQDKQDLRRNTSYNTEFCVPAVLGPMRSASTTKLPPLEPRYMPEGIDAW